MNFQYKIQSGMHDSMSIRAGAKNIKQRDWSQQLPEEDLTSVNDGLFVIDCGLLVSTRRFASKERCMTN